jgi:SAM-dependent methyltransferase
MTKTTAASPAPGLRSSSVVLRSVLVMAAGLLALAIVFFAFTSAAEHGVLGAGLQSWVRIERSRFVFNELYSMATPPFDQTPSAFLVRSVENLPPGTALEVAAGQGRNALYLAQKGWRVTAFDISDKGLEVAQRNARRAGVTLTTTRSSAQDFNFGRNCWDLVLLVYAPIPYDDAELIARIRESIKPGGFILADNPVAMHEPSGQHPRVPGDLDHGELPSLFPGFEILQYTESQDVTDWYHVKMPVARLLAKKR